MVFDWESTKIHLFLESRIAKVLAVEGDVKTLKYELCKGRWGGGGGD